MFNDVDIEYRTVHKIPNSQELFEMCIEHFNEPFIHMNEIARCIGYGETALDCYVIAKTYEGKIIWITCVGGYIWLNRLKEQGVVIPNHPSFPGEIWNDFVRIENSLQINRCPREEKFILDLRPDDEERQNFS